MFVGRNTAAATACAIVSRQEFDFRPAERLSLGDDFKPGLGCGRLRIVGRCRHGKQRLVTTRRKINEFDAMLAQFLDKLRVVRRGMRQHQCGRRMAGNFRDVCQKLLRRNSARQIHEPCFAVGDEKAAIGRSVSISEANYVYAWCNFLMMRPRRGRHRHAAAKCCEADDRHREQRHIAISRSAHSKHAFATAADESWSCACR